MLCIRMQKGRGSIQPDHRSRDRAPLLLLPGTLCDARLWQPQIQALRDTIVPVVVDVGQADRTVELARLVLADAPPRFALAGFSLGGILALEIIAQAPDRVTHLALVSSNARPLAEADAAARRAAVEAAARAGLRDYVAGTLLPTYLPAAKRADQQVVGLILAMAEDAGLEVFRRQTEAVISRADSRPRLGRIGVPTLVVGGAEDRLCPPDRQEEMAAAIRGAELLLLPGCGHFAPLEEPVAVGEALRRLLAAPR